LKQARSLLQPNGRVILAHVNGAKFVHEERELNKDTVLSNMPSFEELSILCDNDLKSFKIMPLEGNSEMQDFYLIVLVAI
jgi:hypothetical protein